MSPKVKIIISDTHIGAGGVQDGNRLEDFTSDQTFFRWVHRLIAESDKTGAEMTFIINGDWIEFLQVPDVEAFDPSRIYPEESYTDRSVAAALQRLEVVHAGHPLVFQALADFLSPGPQRRSLAILFGNHDPELAYSLVQERILTLLGARGRKRDLVHIGGRIYFEDGVYVEHGNAYTERINRFTDPDHPFDIETPELIERPAGSYVVTDYFNRIERQRPWIDGVHPLSSLIFYALAYDPVFALQALKAFLLAAPNLLVDVVAAAPEESASQDVRDEREAADEQTLARRLASDEVFATAFYEQAAAALAEKGAAPAFGKQTDMATGTISSAPPDVRAREIAEQYWRMLAEAAARVAVEHNARVVSFGHIHEEVEEHLPSDAVYLNTGTWIWKANFRDSPDEVWRDLTTHPQKYMNQRSLAYARIDIAGDGSIVAARLLRANDPPAPPDPPDPMPEPGLWARFVLMLRKIVAKVTGWL